MPKPRRRNSASSSANGMAFASGGGLPDGIEITLILQDRAEERELAERRRFEARRIDARALQHLHPRDQLAGGRLLLQLQRVVAQCEETPRRRLDQIRLDVQMFEPLGEDALQRMLVRKRDAMEHAAAEERL